MKEQQTQALARVLSQASEEAVLRLAAAVEAHARVFVCAAGRSGLMLRAFAMRLAQMGRTVYVAGETVTPAIAADDLLVLASASGRTASVLHAAQVARACGARLFVISARPDSPLADLHAPDLLLAAPDKDVAGPDALMGTLFEQALLLTLDEAVLRMRPSAEGMRAAHANLE